MQSVIKFKSDLLYKPFLNPSIFPFLPSPSRTHNWCPLTACPPSQDQDYHSLLASQSLHNSSPRMTIFWRPILYQTNILIYKSTSTPSSSTRFVWTLPRIHGGGIITICYIMHKNAQITCSCLAQFLPWYSRSPPGYKLSFSRLPLSLNYQDTGLYPLPLSSLPTFTWIYSLWYSAQCVKKYTMVLHPHSFALK